MPVELRKVMFSEDELRAAVIDYCLRSKIRLPEANIERIVVGEDPESCVTLKYYDTDNPNDADDVKLSRDQVAAALIRYCGEQKVPLPRAGRKILQTSDEGVALLINIQWEKRPKAAAKE